jgi:dipeptidyl aminopeptidase/acylaminoacyl peptidase
MPVAPYGSWASPITSDLVTADAIRLDQVMLDGGDIYWTESHPGKQGRVLVYRQRAGGAVEAVTPEDGQGWNVRTRAHEYGGGAFTVANGRVLFSHYADQCLYRQQAGEAPQRVTAPAEQGPAAALRYADGTVDARRNRVFLVQEDHSAGGEARNTLVRLDLGGAGAPSVVASGHDFYAAPRLSPDGRQLAWLTWDHPHMPWVTSDLWLAAVAEDGSLGSPQRIAGGPDEALFQPQWSPAGELYFVSDRDSGWWNLHRLRDGRVEPVLKMAAEFGKPQWNFNMSTYGFAAADRLICAYVKDGIWKLGSLDTGSGKLTAIATRFTEIAQVRAGGGQAVFLGGSGSEPESLVAIDLATGAERVIRASGVVSEALRPYISTPETIAFPTAGGEIAHAFYYPPASKDYSAPEGEKVPVLVKSHGGPTASSGSTLNFSVQYWTSRGFGLLDVNYRGSTGYGRAYRLRLEKTWGIVDVDDCAHGARHLVATRNADPARLAIRGGSAGGYTTLRALTAAEKTFSAGASHYGVSDLAALARDTHKFESRYLDWLIGPYPADEKIYAERSPINHIDKLTVPVIFFQGTEDEVVPPNQTQMMVDGLKDRNVPVGYLLFEGEQHGFRKAENIRRALDAELYFYAALLTRSGLRYL